MVYWKKCCKENKDNNGGASQDLSNYYTKNQTNELLNNYYNKIQIDSLLSDFDSEIDDLQSQITNINGSLVSRDELNNLQTTLNNDIQELGNELNSLSQSVDNLETNLQNQINELKSNGGGSRTIFYQGQCLLFESGSYWNTIKNRYNLIKNTDYRVNTNGRFIKIADGNRTGGNAYIEEKHIKKISKPVIKNERSIYCGLLNDESIAGYCQRQGGQNTNYTNVRNLLWPTIDIGRDTPDKYEPEYITRYEVVILRDIIVGGEND